MRAMLIIHPDGQVRCLYTEVIDLRALGVMHIIRASYVEPDDQGRWWADLSATAGVILGPFGTRSEALTAERECLEHALASMASAEGRDQ